MKCKASCLKPAVVKSLLMVFVLQCYVFVLFIAYRLFTVTLGENVRIYHSLIMNNYCLVHQVFVSVKFRKRENNQVKLTSYKLFTELDFPKQHCYDYLI